MDPRRATTDTNEEEDRLPDLDTRGFAPRPVTKMNADVFGMDPSDPDDGLTEAESTKIREVSMHGTTT